MCTRASPAFDSQLQCTSPAQMVTWNRPTVYSSSDETEKFLGCTGARRGRARTCRASVRGCTPTAAPWHGRNTTRPAATIRANARNTGCPARCRDGGDINNLGAAASIGVVDLWGCSGRLLRAGRSDACAGTMTAVGRTWRRLAAAPLPGGLVVDGPG